CFVMPTRPCMLPSKRDAGDSIFSMQAPTEPIRQFGHPAPLFFALRRTLREHDNRAQAPHCLREN
ncbi:MAG: hypothetical protein ACYCY8_11910, partial [Burkholderiales bacterium]